MYPICIAVVSHRERVMWWHDILLHPPLPGPHTWYSNSERQILDIQIAHTHSHSVSISLMKVCAETHTRSRRRRRCRIRMGARSAVLAGGLRKFCVHCNEHNLHANTITRVLSQMYARALRMEYKWHSSLCAVRWSCWWATFRCCTCDWCVFVGQENGE